MTNFVERFHALAAWLIAKLERGWTVYVESLPSMADNFMWLLVISACAFAIEAITVGWRECSLRKVLGLSGTVRNDLFALFLNYSGIGNYIALLMTFALIYFPVKHLRAFIGTPLLQFDSLLVAGLIYILLADFSMYWFHRFAHRWGALWSVHAYHHSASDMTILSGGREHPLVFPLISVWMIVPTALLAPQQEVGWLLVVLVLTRIHGLLIHSNILSDWGWFGRYVLVSPAMHRVHHGVANEFHNSNYGSLLTLWDHLFGTWKDPRCMGGSRIAVGLDDVGGDLPPWRYLMRTYSAFLTSFFSPFQGLIRRLRRT
ncbi:sterol desaturase/sphingolipid hydroxylase (fatty acid hydroxylase superfamily) [Paucibacter oligotrophus]|uniref:Sterol desaturase/sphingolipid hydroxylase (Fatty acid hydroxylase superfamily) n=1 Tax=Roseateles oligotrophus TaxID=1769250 RepID=A0A840L6U8_9BURK|nr:sterol desaturase family protein [Roseateles oligotrophus]MBB4842412.1 sterol desaturase/sphingolipid hydroxylase (fatty acid hydroxylase superfamily) [Roseateles oligotrophus]